MDTHGHHRVLAEGAEPRLRRAYGRRRVNYNPLFLGNWLADLSQVHDPGSGMSAQLARELSRRELRAAAAKMATRIEAVLAGVADPPPEGRPVGALAKLLRKGIVGLLERFFAVLAAGEGGTLGPDLLRLVRVLGYLKFARPESNPDGLAIPYDTYTQIFEELCRQYFPHEHLDRPPCAVSYRPHGPPCEAAWGPEHAHRRDRLYATGRAGGADRHLYAYLADQRRVLAGRLQEIDLGWASRDLASASPSDRDLWLARLGHALHGVEDFFAHSTFIEHAVLAAEGPAGLERALRGRTARRVGEPVDLAIAWRKVERRLRRYSPDPRDPGQPEDAVVTGYFDGWDTLNSMLHFAEELIRPHLLAWETRERRGALEVTIRELLGTYAEEVVGDVLELLKIRVAPGGFEQRVHQALDGLMEYVEQAVARGEAVSRATVTGRASRDPVLRLLPEELLRDHLVPAVLGLTRLAAGMGTGVTIYRALKTISAFYRDPLGYLLRSLLEDGPATLLKAWIGIAAELAGKDLLVRLNYVILGELQELLRADRVGCHSLLAKDQPTEPLFDEMFRCARHVDWFIVDTLCRWSDPEWAGRTEESRRWVRWDDLLAAYLRSPLDTPRGQRRRVRWHNAVTWRSHVVSGERETLRSVYLRLAAGVDGVREIASYEEFLVANFGLDGVLTAGPVAGVGIDERAVVRLATASGLAVADAGGYRLMPGVRLVLPVRHTVGVDVVEGATWFGDVLRMSDEEWERAAKGYEASRLTTSPPEFAHHTLTYHEGATAEAVRRSAENAARAAASIRAELERAYPRG